MDLIDANRFLVPLLLLPLLNPFVVGPFVPIEVKDQRRRLNSVLPEKTYRVALQYDLPETIPDLELVMRTFDDPWNKYLPDSRFYAFSHRMGPPIPSVEIAHDADSLCIRGPNRKTATSMTIDLSQVSAKFVVNLVVVSLLVQMH